MATLSQRSRPSLSWPPSPYTHVLYGKALDSPHLSHNATDKGFNSAHLSHNVTDKEFNSPHLSNSLPDNSWNSSSRSKSSSAKRNLSSAILATSNIQKHRFYNISYNNSVIELPEFVINNDTKSGDLIYSTSTYPSNVRREHFLSDSAVLTVPAKGVQSSESTTLYDDMPLFSSRKFHNLGSKQSKFNNPFYSNNGFHGIYFSNISLLNGSTNMEMYESSATERGIENSKLIENEKIEVSNLLMQNNNNNTNNITQEDLGIERLAIDVLLHESNSEVAITKDQHSPVTNTMDQHSAVTNTMDQHSPVTNIIDQHSPVTNTMNQHETKNESKKTNFSTEAHGKIDEVVKPIAHNQDTSGQASTPPPVVPQASTPPPAAPQASTPPPAVPHGSTPPPRAPHNTTLASPSNVFGLELCGPWSSPGHDTHVGRILLGGRPIFYLPI